MSQTAQLANLLLMPLSGLYRLATTARNIAFDRELIKSIPSPLPVICVGNITAGGSGKTPCIGYLAEKLAERGMKPVVLSRGYGGKVRGPHLVSDTDTPESVGDEPLLHHQALRGKAQVVVARARAEGALFISEQQLGDVILMDDGYQHRRLARDLNILLLDVSSDEAVARWRKGSLLPAGRLRETLHQGLSRADCVLFVQRSRGTGKEPTYLAPLPSGFEDLPRFTLTLAPTELRDLHSGRAAPLSDWSGRTAAAATAIAHPGQFFDMLRGLGISLSDTRAFRDHHLFTADDWRALAALRPLVVTAKDAVKLSHYVREEGEVFVVSLSAQVRSAQERQFLSLIEDACSVRRRAEDQPENKV